MIADAASGRMPAYVQTGINVVHVDDVAEGHVLALERGRIGERYILGSENLMLPDILAMVDDVTGRRQRRFALRTEWLWPVALASEGFARVSGKEPRVTRDHLRMARKKMFFSHAKAAAELGYAPRPAYAGDRRRGCLVRRAWHAGGVSVYGFLAGLSLLAWVYLAALHGKFWQAGPVLKPAKPEWQPSVVAVVPARDEASLVGRSLASLLAQSRVTARGLRGCGSCWWTTAAATGPAAVARALDGQDRLRVIEGAERPPGWAGKPWALFQGIAASESEWLLLTDADIEHDSGHLASLLAHAETSGADMVSEMVALRCQTWAERALVPAFVFFFQLLYPFAWVNDPHRRTAAAAGGTVLIRRSSLRDAGGIEGVGAALIDDVELARLMKGNGAKIWLGHSVLARSLRAYPRASDVWRMVARSAYTQLRWSPWRLAATMAGMALLFLLPPVATLATWHGAAHWFGLLAWTVMAFSFEPTLERMRVSPLWAPLLPLIAAFYMAATIGSAVAHYRGRGVVWKQRTYTESQA